ncbi:MAG: trypsin, partial [Pseudomonadota bacterium]
LTGIRIDYGNFETYDIEPPATGDVLAGRPIIVFGKWRGKPNGVIRLSGITGDRPFSKALTVSVFSPERQNEALRFLWARHRIAFLSDYNLLKPDDRRIEEVTRLGLAYNLLTDYTSFVAIDTQVRLKNGKAITVKQPLPLPQGVSDLAVGGGARRGAFKSLAAPQSVPGHNQRVLTEEARTDSADKPVITLQLQKVTVKGGLSVPLVQPIVERHFGILEACIREHFKDEGRRERDVEIVFFIKPDGNIEKVEVKGLTEPPDPFQECIAIKMANVIFPKPSGGDKATITVAVIMN